MDVPVVWLAPPAETRPAGETVDATRGMRSGAREAVARSREQEYALSEWGRAHGVQPSAPKDVPTAVTPVDLTLADRVEEELEHARDASSTLDAVGTDQALLRAESLLRTHPELPQGAWLMAEVERAWAKRWSTVLPKDPERAAAAWRRAHGLDGGRAPGVGEEKALAVESEVPFQLVVDGRGVIRLDGREVPSGELRAQPGEHQLVVTREGGVVWAGWVAVTSGSVVRVAPALPPPCSVEDLANVHRSGSVIVASGVACPRWVVAEPGPADNKLHVSECGMDRCGALVEWSVGGADLGNPGGGAAGSHWPAWATWTLVGLGAAAVAGATVGLVAAFHTGSPEPPYYFNGTQRQAPLGPPRRLSSEGNPARRR